MTHLAEDRRRDGGPDEGFGVTVVVRNVLVTSHKSPEFLASWLDLIERWFADIARERILWAAFGAVAT